MKTNKTITSIAFVCLLLLLVALSGCQGGQSVGYVNATGRPGEIMLVMSKQYLDAPVGVVIQKMLTAEVPAQTQPEKMMKVSRTTDENFSGFLTYVRNVMIVEIDAERFTHTSVKFDYDVWAKNQLVVKITSPAPDSVTTYVGKNHESLMNIILRHELYRFVEYLGEEYSAAADKKVDSLFGYHINVPKDIRKHKISKDFLWMSNDAIDKRHDLMVYSFPYQSPKDLQLDRLVEVRDSVLKANIEGGVAGSHPITVTDYGLLYRSLTMGDGSRRSEVRGIWNMTGGAMMAGPFISQAVYNKEQGKVYVIEGFVYNPNKEKRDMTRMMEASLYTFRPDKDKRFVPEQIKLVRYSPFF